MSRALLSGIAGVIGGLGFGIWLGTSSAGDAGLVQSARAVVPATAEVERAPTIATAAWVPSAPPPTLQAPSSSPRAHSCPEGMRLVAARTMVMRRGPHPRPDWPKPARAPGEVEVAAFCMDAAPVSTASFVGGLSAAEMRRRARLGNRCNSGQEGAALPANCLSPANAQEHCAARGLRLPTVAEWEAAARAQPPVTLSTGTGEWASDVYPPAVFGHTPAATSAERMWFDKRIDSLREDAPHLSWHHRAIDDASLPNVSFRCAQAVGMADRAGASPVAR